MKRGATNSFPSIIDNYSKQDPTDLKFWSKGIKYVWKNVSQKSWMDPFSKIWRTYTSISIYILTYWRIVLKMHLSLKVSRWSVKYWQKESATGVCRTLPSWNLQDNQQVWGSFNSPKSPSFHPCDSMVSHSVTLTKFSRSQQQTDRNGLYLVHIGNTYLAKFT